MENYYTRKYITYAVIAIVLYFIFPYSGYYQFTFDKNGWVEYRCNKLTGVVERRSDGKWKKAD